MCMLYTYLNRMLHQFLLVQTQNISEILISAKIPFVNLNLSRISAETKISDLSKISAEIWLRLETFCESGPSCIFPTKVSVRKHQRRDCDLLHAPQWVNMDARYIRLYYKVHANPTSEWGDLATLARGMYVGKSQVTLETWIHL